MTDKCQITEIAMWLKGAADAHYGIDSSNMTSVHKNSIKKMYLRGYMEGERTIHKKHPIKKVRDELLFLDVVPMFRDPKSIFGQDFIKPFTEATQEWQKAVYDAKAEGDIETQRELWNDIVRPLAEDHLETIDTRFGGDVKGEAIAYLNDMRDGTEVFARFDKDQSPILDRVDNAVSKVVAWNVDIFWLNFLEYNRVFAKLGARKAFAGLAKSTVELAKVAVETKSLFFKEVPSLKKKGVYGRPKEEYRSGLISISDNWLRTASYYAGESFGGGHAGGMDGLKQGAFGYELGNTPKFARRAEFRSQLTLMRYGLEMYKFLGSAAVDLSGVNGGKRAAQGASTLLLWALLQSAMTGARSAVPAGMWELLESANPDLIDKIKEMDESEGLPLNLVGKNVGFGVTKKAQPGGLSVGIGFDIVNKDYGKTFSNLKKSIKAAKKGDIKEAYLLGGKAALMWGATTSVPGWGSINTMKLYDVLEDYLRGEIDETEIVPRATEKVVTLQTPLTQQGKKDYKYKTK